MSASYVTVSCCLQTSFHTHVKFMLFLWLAKRINMKLYFCLLLIVCMSFQNIVVDRVVKPMHKGWRKKSSNCRLWIRMYPVPIIISPAGDVAKYCDEYVSLCVCLSSMISPGPHARSLPNVLFMLPMSVARSFSGMLTIGRIAYRREGGDGSAERGRGEV